MKEAALEKERQRLANLLTGLYYKRKIENEKDLKTQREGLMRLLLSGDPTNYDLAIELGKGLKFDMEEDVRVFHELLDRNYVYIPNDRDYISSRWFYKYRPENFFKKRLKGIPYLRYITLPQEFDHFPTQLDSCPRLSGIIIPHQRQQKKDKDWPPKLKFDILDYRIANFPDLNTIIITKTTLREVSKQIGTLDKLVHLKFQACELESIPDSICELPLLKGLDLNHNRLKAIPQNIGNLTELRKLNLSNNQLRTLPESLGNLWKLEEIDISGNPLEKTLIPESLFDEAKAGRLIAGTLKEYFGL